MLHKCLVFLVATLYNHAEASRVPSMKFDKAAHYLKLKAAQHRAQGCFKTTSLDRSQFSSRLESPAAYLLVIPEDLPDRLDYRNVNGKNLVTKDVNQHIPMYCGGCWAHGALAAISDRLKVMRDGAWPDINLSTAYIFNCGAEAGSCNGGSDVKVYEFLTEQGIPDDTCQIYTGTDLPCNSITRCMNCDPPTAEWPTGKCYAQPQYLRYYMKEYGHLPIMEDVNAPDMITQMKSEIFLRGPISCQVDASPMEKYQSGIISAPDAMSVDHVIEVAGWDYDEEQQKEYWICRNSWGTGWGESGWFRVEMGVNSMQIETGCSFGILDWPPRVITVPEEHVEYMHGYQLPVPDYLKQRVDEDTGLSYAEKIKQDEALKQQLLKQSEEAERAKREAARIAGGRRQE